MRKNNLALKPELEPEAALETRLRPTRFSEFIGQERLKENLRVFVQAAIGRGEPLDHTLLEAPPGMGKTTLAMILARELRVNLRQTSGPALERVGDLAAILSSLSDRDVFFIDEIHRIPRAVEEALYPAMEDYRLDIVTGKGPSAQTLKLSVPRFTLIGATTRAAMLSGPLRDRFGICGQIEFYTQEDLTRITLRSAKILGVSLPQECAQEIARRARFTPRVANRLLKRVRDFAEVEAKGRISPELVRDALGRMEIDEHGLDRTDRRFLQILLERFNGGPVGLESMAAIMGEDPDTLAEVVEPYLLQAGFLDRTPKGRVATPKTRQLLSP